MFRAFKSRIYIAIILLLGILIFGVLGFMIIEKMSLANALYMAVITISTVGFQEVQPLSMAGRMFTVVVIVFMLGIFTYSISVISSYFLDGTFQTELKRKRMKDQINRLTNHVILCGYGRNGHQAAEEFANHGISFVVIEKSEEYEEEFYEKNFLHLKGDATDDQVLHDAGIEKASALITTLPQDADNVYVVLTARELKPTLRIISRATGPNSEKKLKIAGADNVIMPDRVGGSHMASLVIKPDIMEFIDIITGQRTPAVQIDQINVDDLPEEYRKKSLIELEIRKRFGANVIGYRKAAGDYVINPSANTQIEPHSKIIVLGTREEIRAMKNLFLRKQDRQTD